MQFIAIPAEQTTALTDALLGLEALILAGWLQRFVRLDRLRARWWQSLLLLMALASFLGTAAHGLVLSHTVNYWLWIPLLLALGLVVGNLVLVAMYDLFGPRAAKRAWPWLLIAAVGFFGLTRIEGVTFLLFVLYEAVGMLLALMWYVRLARQDRLAGAGLIAAGIVLQLVAAGVQAAGPYQFKLIWVFDHNGLFHLIGLAATLVMILGAARGFSRSGLAD